MALQASAAGFTLLELLIVLTIVALFTTWLSTTVHRDVDDAAVRAATRVLAADLRWLRQQAVSLRQETGLVLDLRGKRYVRTADRLERTLPANADVRFSALAERSADEASAIRFFPDGTSTGGAVELIHGAKVYRVSVSWPFGRVEARI